MSSTSEQISILFQQGNSADQIADLLVLDLCDVLMILHGAGQLTKKRLATQATAQATNNRGGASDIVVVEDLSVEQIYQKYQKQIARNIVNIAMAEPTEEVPSSVILKAGIYVNEEATGRNEARAKKNNNSLLIGLAEIIASAKNANERVNQILDVSSSNNLENNGLKVSLPPPNMLLLEKVS